MGLKKQEFIKHEEKTTQPYERNSHPFEMRWQTESV